MIGSRPGTPGPVCFVEDNGIGVDPRHHQRIFNLFERLDPAVEGTGIGLALVKRIVEVHGGEVWVESEGAGRGSRFCFVLGVQPAAAEETLNGLAKGLIPVGERGTAASSVGEDAERAAIREHFGIRSN